MTANKGTTHARTHTHTHTLQGKNMQYVNKPLCISVGEPQLWVDRVGGLRQGNISAFVTAH